MIDIDYARNPSVAYPSKHDLKSGTLRPYMTPAVLATSEAELWFCLCLVHTNAALKRAFFA